MGRRYVGASFRVTCPYCFQAFHPGDAPSRDPREKVNGVDEFATRHLGTKVNMSPLIPARPGLFGKFWIDTLHQGGPRKVCPNCHLYLPLKTATGELPSPGVAIIGGRASGKSHFIAVLLDQLEKRYGPEAGFSIDSQDTFDLKTSGVIRSSALYRRRYGGLMQGGKELDVTRSAETGGEHVEVRIPLIYRLLFDARHSSGERRAMNLVLYDAAGEDLETPEKQERFCKHVAAVTGLIFLIDPCEIPGLVPFISAEVMSRSRQEGLVDGGVASIIIDQLERALGTAANVAFDVPLAVVISKSDVLTQVPGLDRATAVGDCLHRGGLDRQEVSRASNVVRKVLYEHAPNLVRRLEDRFRRIMFFTVSSLGHGPADRSKSIGTMVPVRVGDPLLWLLAEQGYLQDGMLPAASAGAKP